VPQADSRLATTKADAAYLEIRRQIIEGRLPPGAVLDQGEVARSLQISTTPVREALRRLEMEDLVVMSAHRDARVAPLSGKTLKELYELRLVLDPLAAELTADRASDPEIDAICKLAEHHPRSQARQAAANRRFHRAIYSACGNSVLIATLDSLWDRSDRYRLRLLGSPEEVTVASHEHSEIAGALRSRNAKLVARLVREHIEGSIAKIDSLAQTNENSHS